jgi:hypothetical protein
MGQFLSMSGVIDSDEQSVVDALRAFAEENGGSLSEADLTLDDAGCLALSEGLGGVTVLYPADFLGWDRASDFLSRRLGKPAFTFHIHDSDLWMYSLFENGGVVDQFNPIPDYWAELDEDEQQTWRGNAAEVARRVPGLAPDQISNYLVPWSVEMSTAAVRRKAYPADRYYYGDDWQLLDFMDKLGLDFPIDDRGQPHGVTYRFECESGDVG